MTTRLSLYLLAIALVLLFAANLFWGSVALEPSAVWAALTSAPGSRESVASYIVLDSRLPASITALLTGASLAVCGLVLQSFFRNPLVGPSIVGISSGANLGVALVVLLGMQSSLSITLASLTGSFLILGILLLLTHFVRNRLTFLIVGILISYFTSALITLLNYFATSQGAHSFLIWGMGNFSGLGREDLPLYTLLLGIGMSLAALLIKPLNAWSLGTLYAQNLGVSASRLWVLTLMSTGLITAITTAYCGPISFIGLCIPHIARLIFQTDNHQILIPASALCGAVCTLLCQLLCSLPGEASLLPINAITPLIGVPVIVYVVIKGNK